MTENKFWTPEKLEIAKVCLETTNLSYANIAKKLGTTESAFEHAIRRYDLRVKRPVPNAVNKKIDIFALHDCHFEAEKEKAKLKWKITPSTLNQTKKPFKIYLVTTDHHIPMHNEPAIKAILKLMDDIRFDGNIILGDFLDYGCISHWNKGKHKTLELQRLKKDYIIGNAILDEYDKRLPKDCDKRFFKGNHEVWCDDLLEELPALEGLIEPESQLFLEQRGYKIYPYNHIERIGKLSFTHGIYANTNPVKKHIDELKTNIIFGHLHSPEMRFSSSPAREISLAGYCLGSLCDLSPNYMKNKPNAWSHGFATVYFYTDSEYFDVDIKRIVNGRFIFNNRIYDGN